MTEAPRLCQLQGCEVELAGRSDKRFCSRSHWNAAHPERMRASQARYDSTAAGFATRTRYHATRRRVA